MDDPRQPVQLALMVQTSGPRPWAWSAPALLGLLIAVPACAQEESEAVDKPAAPDMTELVADYEAPSGILDQAAPAVPFCSSSECPTIAQMGARFMMPLS